MCGGDLVLNSVCGLFLFDVYMCNGNKKTIIQICLDCCYGILFYVLLGPLKLNNLDLYITGLYITLRLPI